MALLVAGVSRSASSVAHAQQGEDLREAAQNPIADLISLPFQNNTNFDIWSHRQCAECLKHSASLSSPSQPKLEPDHSTHPAGD